MRVVFIGAGGIGLPTLRALIDSAEHDLAGVITQPDRPAGRHQEMRPAAIKAALSGGAVRVFQPDKIRSEEAVAQMRALAPDAIVVMAYGQILPRAVLEIPRLACLNLHASLLPRHRGAAPIQAAIAAGDLETGITVMYMDEGLDTGDILLQSRLKVLANETGGSLHDRLAELAPGALLDALAQLAAGTAPRVPQNPADATYAPKLERDDGEIEWAEPAVTIERKIRAYDPWPGAFMLLRDRRGRMRKLKIFRATVLNDSAFTPGQLSVAENRTLMVTCGRGAVALEQVQLEGKQRMTAAELLRGHPWIGAA